jgi:hypothetical protein
LSRGAQDYLVKGHVDGTLLYRVIRYAVERKQAEKVQLELQLAQVSAQENARLARGLLPSPLVSGPRLTVATRYRPGSGQIQLGGGFYDLVETPDGWLHALVGDVQRLSADRHQVIDVADAAEIQALQLDAGIVNQETGVRGYAGTR